MSIFASFRGVIISADSVLPLTALLLLALGIACARAAEPAAGVSVRCGWFDNPSPGNAWLHDRDGEWAVSIQGERQAKGKWPKFKTSQWVQTGTGGSGYGCACMRVQTNAESKEIIRIFAAYAKSLSACRQDKTLEEPNNPLADEATEDGSGSNPAVKR